MTLLERKMTEIGRGKTYSVLNTLPLRCSLTHVYDKFQTAETVTVDGHKYTHIHIHIHIHAYTTLILHDKPVH